MIIYIVFQCQTYLSNDIEIQHILCPLCEKINLQNESVDVSSPKDL